MSKDAIRSRIASRDLFPCYFGSALKNTGVEEFMRGLEEYTLEPVYPNEFGAKIFKIVRDSQGERLTYMKITGGVLHKSYPPVPRSPPHTYRLNTGGADLPFPRRSGL